MTTENPHKVVIGRAELLHFEDIQVADIPAKVDTGAYRSSVHAEDIYLSEDGKTLHYTLFGGHPIVGKFATKAETQEFTRVSVENSFGHSQDRYVVKHRVRLGLTEVEALFSLANRSKKKYPILIGRRLLNDRFVVDTSITSVDTQKLKDKFDLDFPKDEEGREK